MIKLVMMIPSYLASAGDDVDLPISSSRVIRLLDFHKVYDTVDGTFMYKALRHFHFVSSLSRSFSACTQGRQRVSLLM